MSIYTKLDYDTGGDSSVLQCSPLSEKLVKVKPNLPGAVILIHGVNDVGVSYDQVEQGLCEGLGDRLDHKTRFHSAIYRMPNDKEHEDDRDKVEPDPDAVFFKRQLREGHHTPVIPFYWGFREAAGKFTTGEDTPHGQAVDQYGNRLDKDFSKGGGPFANATSTLVDMWNRGFSAGPYNVVDKLSKDPLRPVLKAPGHMYMVLAAQRLAALVSMIRDYDSNEVVNLVAHSQGCMLSLLAQAFLLQKGLRPADTLVLTHPPYSLVDDVPWTSDVAEIFSGGEDALMHGHYGSISGRQTLRARLETLARIVQGVAAHKHAAPPLAALADPALHRGIVGCEWKPDEDRDNRGKVYLYFCPEDMTVALDNFQGIGWQGVPDYITGQQATGGANGPWGPDVQPDRPTQTRTRQALKEMGPGFFQRVFTAKLRAQGGQKPQPVLVGAAPHDFCLRLEGEDDHDHVAKGADTLRAHHPAVPLERQTQDAGAATNSSAALRKGIRCITGEALKTPVRAEMTAGAKADTDGKIEGVDPIDAAISVTSRYGLQALPQQVIDDPRPPEQRVMVGEYDALSKHECEQVAEALNQSKPKGDSFAIERASYAGKGKLRLVRRETPNEARLRQQKSGESARSFHGAIFGSRLNHKQVTAYDIAIGGGKAVTDPKFYGYLCAVADWRLKEPKPGEPTRPGILVWKKFQEQFDVFYGAEPDWRKKLIEGNCTYYSTGKLPKCLPILPAGLPPAVVSETMSGQRIESPPELEPEKPAEAERQTTGEWSKQDPLPKGVGIGSAA